MDSIQELHYPQPPNKRPRHDPSPISNPLGKEDEDDKFTKLPEHVIDRILSRLPTKDAIRTSVLSKCWHYRWTKVPRLWFTLFRDNLNDEDGVENVVEEESDDGEEEVECNDDENDNVDEYESSCNEDNLEMSKDTNPLLAALERDATNRRFVDFVTGALSLHNSPKIESFLVVFDYLDEFEPRVTQWVDYVTSRQVEELCLMLQGKIKEQFITSGGTNDGYFACDLYMLPQHLYSNPSIKVMWFNCCEILPRSNVIWSSLERLEIRDTVIKEDVIKKILVGSPKLEYLELGDCRGFSFVDTFSSASLKTLVIDGFRHGGGPKMLEIAASSNLEIICLTGDFLRTKCRLVNVPSSLKHATLNFRAGLQYGQDGNKNMYVEYQYMLLELLDKIGCVQTLRVGQWCIKVLSMSKMKNVSSPFLSCKQLVLETLVTEYELPGVLSLLESSQNLKKLFITSAPISNLQLQFVPHFANSRNSRGRKNVFKWSRNKQLRHSLRKLKWAGIIDSRTRRYTDKAVEALKDLLSLKKVKIQTSN